jgi:putative ABC transport system permease protein
MSLLGIAYRNICRNKRRSLMTVLAIAVSSVSVLLFGGNIISILYSLQTGYVRTSGHIHIYKRGYSRFGAGNPGAYAMTDYERVISVIKGDPELKPIFRAAMPFMMLQGIAGNFKANSSRGFAGIGIVPSQMSLFMTWDQYHLKVTKADLSLGMGDQDIADGVIGYGMAENIKLCKELKIEGCAEDPAMKKKSGSGKKADFSALAAEDFPPETENADIPRLDLLAATAGGSPNVVTMTVHNARRFGSNAQNNGLIVMHLDLAQKLICGRGTQSVTGIMLQLNRTDDIGAAVRRLQQLLPESDYEVKSFGEVSPMYQQTITMFATVFGFVAFIMGVIVLFTTINTMSMSVMERVSEIGTTRALGLRRGAIMKQFVTEGFLLGVIGTTLGAAFALAASAAVNWAEVTWTPPDYATPVLLSVHLFLSPVFLPACWLGLIAVTTLSSVMPARGAARMPIVDALRHI